MSTAIKERRFGVEIECGFPGYTEEAYDLLMQNDLEPWCYNIHEDGSGIEICSPILQGEQGLNELKKVYGLLNKNGAYVTAADGMHVHHDAPDFVDDYDAVIRIVEMWAANQGNIDQLVHHLRRNSWAARKSWDDSNIQALKSHKDSVGVGYNGYGKLGYSTGGRGALNIAALNEHGTIEFRQHEGTLDFNIAAAWIKFGQAFMASAMRRKEPLLTCRTPKELLYRIRNNSYASQILLAKDTETDMGCVSNYGACECSECYTPCTAGETDEQCRWCNFCW